MEFVVVGKPRTKGSWRTVGKGRFIPDNPQMVDWVNAVRQAYQEKNTDPSVSEEGIIVECIYEFARPKSHYGTGKNADVLKPSAPYFPIKRGADIDKLNRCILDALTGLAYVDDSQVVRIVGEKHWVGRTDREGATICISEAR